MQFVRARWYQEGRLKPIRVMVIHDMEAPEGATTAENIAHYFANESPDRKSSAHYCIDQDSVVQCVPDKDTAYAAPGCNSDGLHFEHAGYARQSLNEWLLPASQKMLVISAKLVAAKCRQYGVPPVKLTVAQLKAGQKGIVGHIDVTNAYHESTHTDPGPGFPWFAYIDMVRVEYDALAGKPWTKSRVGALFAALGLSAAVWAGLTTINDPAPAPKPRPTTSVPAPAPKPTVKPAPKPTVKPAPKPVVKPKPKPVVKPGPKHRLVIPKLRNLAYGKRNADVRVLQLRLIAKGYRIHAGATGYFGPQTKAAVRAFQLHQGWRGWGADGIPGPLTIRHLFR